MYNVREMKFKSHVSYSEMLAVALQYAKDAREAALENGDVARDFRWVSAIMYTFAEVGQNTLNGDEVMAGVYAYGYGRWLEYVREHNSMGPEYYDAFTRMLGNADKAADKAQHVEMLMDSMIALADNMNALLQKNADGSTGVEEMLKLIRGVANNEGEGSTAP